MSRQSLTSKTAIANNDEDERNRLVERLSGRQGSDGLDQLYSGEMLQKRIDDHDSDLASGELKKMSREEMMKDLQFIAFIETQN